MIERLYGPPRIEFFVHRRRRRPYAVRVILERFVIAVSSQLGRGLSNMLVLCLIFAGIRMAPCVRAIMFSSSRRFLRLGTTISTGCSLLPTKALCRPIKREQSSRIGGAADQECQRDSQR
jgi:hypothetical protein